MPTDLYIRDSRIKEIEQQIEDGFVAGILEEIDSIEKSCKDDKTKLLYIDIMKCRVLLISGEFEKSYYLADSIISRCTRANKFGLAFDSFMIKLQSLIKLEMIAEGLEELSRGEKLLQIIGEDIDRLVTLNLWKGIISFNRGYLDESLEYLQGNLTYRGRVKCEGDIASTLNSIGMVFWQKGDFDHALEYLLQSWFLRKKIGNKRDIADSLLGMGNVFSDMGNYDQSLEYYKQSKDYFHSLNDHNGEALVLNRIRIIFQHLGDRYYDSASEIQYDLSKIDCSSELSEISKRISKKQKNKDTS